MPSLAPDDRPGGAVRDSKPVGPLLIKNRTLLIYLITAPLFFMGLGDTYLWNDEAQTARLGASVLTHGVPLTGTGPDCVSADCSRDAGWRGLHLQIPFLQSYVAAASIGVFGPSSIAARLPFALAGWACVGLAMWLAGLVGAASKDRLLAGALVGTSVYFLLHARQARYYAIAAMFVLLIAAGYWLFLQKRGRGTLLTAGLVGLVLTFDVAAVGILLGLGLHAVTEWVRGRLTVPGLKHLALALAPPVAVLAMWLALTSSAPTRGDSTLSGLALRAIYYPVQFNAHVLPLLVLLPALIVAGRRLLSEQRGQFVALTGFLLAGGVAGAVLPPLYYPRYLIAFVPLTLVGLSVLVGMAAERSRSPRLAVALVGALLIAGVPHKLSHDIVLAVAEVVGVRAGTRLHPPEAWRPVLIDFLGELRDPPRGPVAEVVEHLRAYADVGDAVVALYGVPTLRFHTHVLPYGGLACTTPTDVPEWIWIREPWRTHARSSLALQWLETNVDWDDYELVPLSAPDRKFENRADIHSHVFGNPGPAAPPTKLYRRRSTG